MNKKRIDYLDMVKGIGIFLVVLGHMEDISTITRVWISSFHMPLFFIVSGLIMAITNEPDKDITVSIKKKWQGIIIPYMWFSLGYFFIDILNCWVVKNIDFRTFIVDTISSVTFYGMSVLWFLPALFIASIGFLLLKKRFPDKIILILLIAIAVISYVIKLQVEKVYAAYADSLLITSLINIVYIFLRAFVAMCFVGYAYYIRRGYELLISKDKWLKLFSSKLFCLGAGIVLMAVNICLAMINECVDLHNIILNNVPIYFIAAFAGTYGIILICKGIPSIKLIMYYGRNSLIVMAVHINFYFLYAGIRLAWVIDPFVKHAKHYVFVAITVATVFVLSTIVIEVINRFFPFVLGKSISQREAN